MPKIWFRIHADLLNNPKFQRLSDRLKAQLVNLWCVAAKNDGALPETDELAFLLRIEPDQVHEAVNELRTAGFLDDTANGLVPHDWAEWQYESDSSTPRVRALREKRKRNGDETLHETPVKRFTNVSDGVTRNVTVTAPEQSIDRIKAEQSQSKSHQTACDLSPSLDGQSQSGQEEDADTLYDWFFDHYPGQKVATLYQAFGESMARNPDKVGVFRANTEMWLRVKKVASGYGLQPEWYLRKDAWLSPPLPLELPDGAEDEAIKEAIERHHERNNN